MQITKQIEYTGAANHWRWRETAIELCILQELQQKLTMAAEVESVLADYEKQQQQT